MCNSSPLIHLARIGWLGLLQDFFDEVLIPEAVYRECVVEGEGRDDAIKIKNATWLQIKNIANIELKRALLV